MPLLAEFGPIDTESELWRLEGYALEKLVASEPTKIDSFDKFKKMYSFKRFSISEESMGGH
jgi:hypothetical protein